VRKLGANRCACRFMAHFGHGAMSDLSPVREQKQTSRCSIYQPNLLVAALAPAPKPSMAQVRLAAADGRARFNYQIMSHQRRRHGLHTANQLAADDTLFTWGTKKSSTATTAAKSFQETRLASAPAFRPACCSPTCREHQPRLAFASRGII
jgi:hypothetical protein